MKQSERGKVCALTGHRDLPENFDDNSLYDSLNTLILQGYDCFLCGMARGFDLRALEALVSLKRSYSIKIEACIPFVGQEEKFSFSEKQKYRELLQWCDQKTVLYDGFFKGCFLARDRYMIDRCDGVLAYCKKREGGTAYTVAYAKQKQKEIFLLD